MRTDDATALLTSLQPHLSGVSSELGTRRDAAYLRLSAATQPDRWAVVSTPGDRWFSLEIDGGFSVDHFEENTADVDVQTLMRDYVEAAVAYVTGATAPERVRRGRRVVKIATGDRQIVLRRSVLSSVKAFLRR